MQASSSVLPHGGAAVPTATAVSQSAAAEAAVMEEETTTAAVLESMGANDYEAKVPALLAEFMRRESILVTLMNRSRKGETMPFARLSESKSIEGVHTDLVRPGSVSSYMYMG